jgi:hypothetical protein
MTITVTDRRLRIVGVLGTLAAVALVATASAQAAGATSAACTVRFGLTITPGFSRTTGSGTLTSDGETGSISCIGKIGGHRVTGPGSVGLEETYTRGNCLSHVGTGTASVTIPTTAGMAHMVGAATSRRTAVGLRAEVEFPDARFGGIGVAIPKHGSCLVTPLRSAQITVIGWLSGA